MIVSDIYEDIKAVLGTCDEATTFNKINEGIEELSNLANWDPNVVLLDICTQNCEITLPDDIEVPLAINVGGTPSDFRNKWFEFHMNGPGSECFSSSCSYSWTDKGNFPTFRDPVKPSQIACYPDQEESVGASLRVYGYDENNQWIMTPDSNNVLQDGFDVPIIYGIGSGLTVDTKVKRITRLLKPVTNGFIRIVALDPGATSGGTLLGIVRPNITEPLFRRIKVSGSGVQFLTNGSANLCCQTWVRMRARLKVFKVTSQTDFIPLHSVTALKLMCMAIKKYEADLLDEYAKYFTAAREALMREQKTRSGPNQIKIQFQHSYAGKRWENMV
jgi:hypothetical protein